VLHRESRRVHGPGYLPLRAQRIHAIVEICLASDVNKACCFSTEKCVRTYTPLGLPFCTAVSSLHFSTLVRSHMFVILRHKLLHNGCKSSNHMRVVDPEWRRHRSSVSSVASSSLTIVRNPVILLLQNFLLRQPGELPLCHFRTERSVYNERLCGLSEQFTSTHALLTLFEALSIHSQSATRLDEGLYETWIVGQRYSWDFYLHRLRCHCSRRTTLAKGSPSTTLGISNNLTERTERI
jgi:hypothetical protein